MDPTKTRIWNADNLGLRGAAHSGSAAHSAHANPAPARDSGAPQPRHSSVPPPPPSARRQPGQPAQPRRSSVPPPPPPSRASLAPLAATRIMPIEQLFPSAQSVANAALKDAPPTQRWHTWKRLGLHVLLGTLTLLAVAAWKLPRAPARARLMPLQAARVASVPVSTQATAQPEVAPQPTVAPAIRAAEKFKTQQERRAIELVIAGDYLAAEEVYRALASERPDTAVFREAARILAARQMPLRGAK